MSSILTTAFKNTIANRSRFALTMVAVALSVAFLTATLVLADSLTGTAADDIAAANEPIDYVIRGAVISSGDSGPGEVPETVTAELTMDFPAALAANPAILDAVGVDEGFAKLVDDGVAVGDATAIDVGRAWVDNPDLNTFTLTEGAAPVGLDEIVIDVAVASEASLAVGDSAQVVTATGLHDMTIAGLASFGGADRAPLQRTVLFSEVGANELMEIDGFNDVLVSSSADLTTVEAAVAAVDDTAAVLSGAAATQAQQDVITSPFAFLSVFLLTFAGLATIVGTTIIYNTFTIAMSQRKRELALTRAIGGTRRMVLAAVMVEALLIAVVATLIGVGLGLLGVGAVRSIMTALGVPFIAGPTVVTSFTLAAAVFVGLVVTLVSAWLPARRASSVAPIEALRDAAAESAESNAVRGIAGVVLTLAGVVALAIAAITSNALALVGGALVVPGLVAVGPALVSSSAKAVRRPLETMFGVSGSVASTNLDRNPRRSASTSLGLTLGVAMVGFFALIASSLSASLTSTLDQRLTADQVVASVAPEYSTIDPTLIDRVRAVPDVEQVGAVAIVEAGLDGAEAVVGGVDPAVGKLFDFAVSEGSLDSLASGGVAVWTGGELPAPAIGDDITLSFSSGELTVPVVAHYDESLSGFDPPTHLVDGSVLDAVEPGSLDTMLFVGMSDQAGATAESVRDVVAETPGALLQTSDDYIANASTEVDSVRNLVFAMLGLTVIIAIVGIANTTALSVSERVRETGLLRAIGSTQRDVRRIVRWEAGVLALIGTALGLAVAFLGAWALVGAVGGSEITALSVPWVQFAILSVAAIGAGVLSAAVPAWRISQLPTLHALEG